MPVYAMHVQTRQSGDTTGLEMFPSVERGQCALQGRVRNQESPAWFVADSDANPTGDDFPKRMVAFPDADETGFMLVWKRKPTDPRPQVLDTPDEVWHLRPRTHGVLRSTWKDYQKAPHAARQEEVQRVLGMVPRRPLTGDERYAKALKAAHQLPPLTDEFKADLDGTARRVLEDLIQDETTLDAVLRYMQSGRGQ